MKKRKETKANSGRDMALNASPESSSSLEQTLKTIFGCSGTRFNQPRFSCQELGSLLRKLYGVRPRRLKQNANKSLHKRSTKGVVERDKMNPNHYRPNKKKHMIKTKEKRKRINETLKLSKKLRRQENQRFRSKIAQSKYLKPRARTAMISSKRRMKKEKNKGRTKSESRYMLWGNTEKTTSQERKTSASQLTKRSNRNPSETLEMETSERSMKRKKSRGRTKSKSRKRLPYPVGKATGQKRKTSAPKIAKRKNESSCERLEMITNNRSMKRKKSRGRTKSESRKRLPYPVGKATSQKRKKSVPKLTKRRNSNSCETSEMVTREKCMKKEKSRGRTKSESRYMLLCTSGKTTRQKRKTSASRLTKRKNPNPWETLEMETTEKSMKQEKRRRRTKSKSKKWLPYPVGKTTNQKRKTSASQLTKRNYLNSCERLEMETRNRSMKRKKSRGRTKSKSRKWLPYPVGKTTSEKRKKSASKSTKEKNLNSCERSTMVNCKTSMEREKSRGRKKSKSRKRLPCTVEKNTSQKRKKSASKSTKEKNLNSCEKSTMVNCKTSMEREKSRGRTKSKSRKRSPSTVEKNTGQKRKKSASKETNSKPWERLAMVTSNRSMKREKSRGRAKSKIRNRLPHPAGKATSQKRKKILSKRGKSCNPKSRRETSSRRSKVNKKLRKSSSFQAPKENTKCVDIVMSETFLKYLLNQASKNGIQKTKSKKKQLNEKTGKVCSNLKKSASKVWRFNQSKQLHQRKREAERKMSNIEFS